MAALTSTDIFGLGQGILSLLVVTALICAGSCRGKDQPSRRRGFGVVAGFFIVLDGVAFIVSAAAGPSSPSPALAIAGILFCAAGSALGLNGLGHTDSQ